MSPIQTLSQELEMPVLRLSAAGVCAQTPAARDWLSELTGAAQRVPLEPLFNGQTLTLLRQLLAGGGLPQAAITLWLRQRDASERPMLALFERPSDSELTVFLFPVDTSLLTLSSEVLERVEILSQMIGAAREACWCIEFIDPVSLGESEDEIVDQVFRNRSRWRACNDAMATLYGVPEDQDFNMQPVQRYFPDTAVNRAMIRELIRTGYRLDGAQAIDQRHDGTPMLVENDFRGLIRDGALIRLWGITRDIGPERARAQEISAEAEVMRDILGAVPDPIFLLSESGIVLAVNPEAERAFGHGQLLGTAFERIASTRNAFKLLQSAALDEAQDDVELTMRAGDEGRISWLFRVAQMPDDPRRYVASARRRSRRRDTKTEGE